MTFWNTSRIKEACKLHQLIDPYDEMRAVRCAYELGVGNEAFVTSTSDKTTKLGPQDKVRIPPGQFGLLSTHETVHVPPDTIAFISIRAKIKFQGLMNVSGFHVDPGFKGRLKFAVYNAGSKDIYLDQQERVFLIWFAKLDAEAPDPRPPEPTGVNFISSEDVSRLSGEVASPAELKKQIDELKKDVLIKFHTIEMHKLFNRALLFILVSAVVGLIIKLYMDDRSAASSSMKPGAISDTSKLSEPALPPASTSKPTSDRSAALASATSGATAEHAPLSEPAIQPTSTGESTSDRSTTPKP